MTPPAETKMTPAEVQLDEGQDRNPITTKENRSTMSTPIISDSTDNNPGFEGDKPEWASEVASDLTSSVTQDGNPLAIWSTDPLVPSAGVDVFVIREDEYDAKRGETSQGTLMLHAWPSGGTDRVSAANPGEARRIAFALLAAADEFDRVLGNGLEFEIETATNVVGGESSGYESITLPPSDWPVFLDNEHGQWRVDFAASNDSLTIDDARVKVQEILAGIHLAERLNRDGGR